MADGARVCVCVRVVGRGCQVKAYVPTKAEVAALHRKNRAFAEAWGLYEHGVL